MAYGSDNDVMSLAYGGAKTVVPGIISTARQNATSIINGYLNLTKDLLPVPKIVDDACNWIASEYVKNPRTPARELLEMADVLLATLKDQLTERNTSRWGNMRFV